jgi:aspartyl-tRNA(Asn)/glutamyl-tRNA(Gln) amidotransferase subunit A
MFPGGCRAPRPTQQSRARIRRPVLRVSSAKPVHLLHAANGVATRGRPIRALDPTGDLSFALVDEAILDGSLESAIAAIRSRSVSALELTEACLARIAARDGDLNAFITVTADDARRRAGGATGPLAGAPVALKDLFDVAGVPTTGGSKLFATNMPQEDGEIARRLFAAGAVDLGKTNLHEWAFGVTTDNPHFGPTRNPWDPDRIPGGSSGGNGAALAAGLCFGTIGSDTGGSIRIPASLCGVVGLKPTYGRISLRGAIPLAWSLDHPGPMTRTVRDAALLLQVVAGYDPHDPVSADVPIDDYLVDIESGVRGLRIGLVRGRFFERLAPNEQPAADVAAAFRSAIDALAAEGARIEDVELPRTDELRPTQHVIIGTEAAAYHRDRIASDRASYGTDVAQRIETGARHSGIAYASARRTRDELRRAYAEALAPWDAIALPTTPITAPPRVGQDAVAAAATLTAYTSPFNLTGLPAISVPCGFDASGLPIGLQLVARPWAEARLLRIARAYERATSWRERRPGPGPA